MVTVADIIVTFPIVDAYRLRAPVWLKIADQLLPPVQACLDAESRNCALALYVAHKAQRENDRAASQNGLVKSVEVNDEGTVEFHKQTESTSLDYLEDLKLTTYGRDLLDLLNPLLMAAKAGFGSAPPSRNIPAVFSEVAANTYTYGGIGVHI